MKNGPISVILFFIYFFTTPLQAQENTISTQNIDNTLKVAVAYYDPPFIMHSSTNRVYGFDIYMMEIICREMKVKCDYIAMPFSRLLISVHNKQADLAISSIIITAERYKKVSFSVPYLVSESQLLGPKKYATQDFNIDILNNKKIGISDDAYEDHIHQIGVKNAIIVSYDENDVMIQELQSGKIDFAVFDSPTTNYWTFLSSGSLVPLGKPMIFGAGFGIAIHPDNTQLMKRLNHALLNFQNSPFFKDGYDKYIVHTETLVPKRP